MQKNQFTDEQILAILQQAEKGQQTIAEVCRQYNVSENSFYRWRSRFGGATTNEAPRLRELEKENARLKRLLAERDLEVDIIKELLQKK
jgi:putative transposase